MNPTLTGDQCTVHGSHRPPVLQTEVHHIWPKAMGGPDVPTNRVNVCPTGHANIHVNIRRLVKDERAVLLGARSERVLARQGVAAWVQAGRPGQPE